MGTWTMQHTAEEVMDQLQREGIPAGVVQNAADIADNPQLKARGFFIETEYHELRKMLSDANPLKISDTPAQYNRPAPSPGEDNNYVFQQLLGMTAGELAELRQKGVI
jgi:crotonobetainyl-CoA:carnitine CoA-transferase CaiB-like acyl-CoA transferase